MKGWVTFPSRRGEGLGKDDIDVNVVFASSPSWVGPVRPAVIVPFLLHAWRQTSSRAAQAWFLVRDSSPLFPFRAAVFLVVPCFAEREHQVPPHSPPPARAEEEVQDYLQGVASHHLLGLSLDCSSSADSFKFLTKRMPGWGRGEGDPVRPPALDGTRVSSRPRQSVVVDTPVLVVVVFAAADIGGVSCMGLVLPIGSRI